MLFIYLEKKEQKNKKKKKKYCVCASLCLSSSTAKWRCVNHWHGRLIYVAGGSYFDRLYQFFEQIMTATVETVSEQLDLAAIMPTEKVMSAVARAVTLSETDVGKKKIRPNMSFISTSPTLIRRLIDCRINHRFRMPD